MDRLAVTTVKGYQMKIEQTPEFQPITVIIETGREAEILWEMVRQYEPKCPVEIAFIRELSDWFSNNAQLKP